MAASSPTNASFHLLLLTSLLLLISAPNLSSAEPRKLTALVQQQPLILKYHNGPLLKGNLTLNILWYGSFSPAQRSVILDFLHSLSTPSSPRSRAPTVASWWRTTERYKGGPCVLSVGNQVLDNRYSLGKLIKSPQLRALALKSGGGRKSIRNGHAINLVLTSADVAVEGFCMSRCGTHGSTGKRSAYAWVGNPMSQCPGHCAWPFHQPIYGPQTPPLVAPNGDVGVDGMVINLATVLAGAVTNPFSNGYFQGPADASLEAVSACTGIFGKGAYPGYPGAVLEAKTTGASYNAVGVNGRKFLLPAMWDPATSTCSPLV
ncbi:protein EXORDIUM-like 2 [Punica granatum]|uniref:Uncharacterized protein n=2 Tax=Punica granatum TaxID=22663 RepID=A0A218X4W8_PUNGR|nr:protein EXORDIUM-like 2 [Punica granatum]OWM79974.1 hypothetical protein CDL15_Pgr006278 [Punica granatum]PKI75411.1 hypothetical protein CRG98_004200 [Punica granatum]